MSSNRVIVRSARPDDYANLHRMEMDPRVSEGWRYHGLTPSPEQFLASFWGGVLVQGVVERRVDGRLAGLVTAYNASPRNGTVFVAVLSEPDLLATGAALEGLALLVTHLFTEWRFRRVFAETFTVNVGPFASAVARLCTEEGRLVQDKYIDGEYADRLYLAIDKERWMGDAGRRVLGREHELRVGLSADDETALTPGSDAAGFAPTPRIRPALRAMPFAEFAAALLAAVHVDTQTVVSPDDRLVEELGFDSVHFLELLVFIDELVATDEPPPDPSDVSTLGDAHRYYTELISTGSTDSTGSIEAPASMRHT